MPIGPITASFAAISPILDYLRPSRSPYLIPCAVGAIIVGRYILINEGMRSTRGQFVPETQLLLIPTIIAFAVFVFLSIRYRDPTLDRSKGLTDSKVVEEIDGQLKFSRQWA